MVVIEWLGISEGAAQFVLAVVAVGAGVVALWNSDWDREDGAEA